MTLSIPNTFVFDTIANADEVNENFDAIANEINGNLANANFDAAAAVEEGKFKFTSEEAGGDGHSHDGTDSTLMPLGTDGVRGAVIFQSGNKEVASESSEAITFDVTYNEVPLIIVGYGSGYSSQYWGVASTTIVGFYESSVAVTGFTIHNRSGSSDTLYWHAIGI